MSSQFISGLLFALPLLEGESTLEITGKLESQSYIALTLSALQKYGITIEHENYRRYRIPGNQQYQPGKGPWKGTIPGRLLAHRRDAGPDHQHSGHGSGFLQGDKAIIPSSRKWEDRWSLKGTDW